MATRLNIPWLKLLKPGSRIYVGPGAACPHGLMLDLVTQAHAGLDWEFVIPPLFGQPEWLRLALEKGIRLLRLYGRPPGGSGLGGHLADTFGANTVELPELFRRGHLPLDAAIVMTTLPDDAGWVGYGTNLDSTSAACEAAPVIIAQLNSELPDFPSPVRLAFNRITHWIELASPPSQLPHARLTPLHHAVAQHAATLIPDNCPLRLPLGAFGQALAEALAERRGLRIYTDVLSEAIRPVMLSGSLAEGTNEVPTLWGSAVAGMHELYTDFLQFPSLRLEPIDVLCGPTRLATLRGLVSAVTPLFLDLSGQAVLKNDPAGISFTTGSSLSDGGFSIALLHSANTMETGIVAQSSLRFADAVHPHVAVTEYGAAQLSGRTESERAAALIEIASPERRQALWEYACQEHGLPRFWPVQWQRLPEHEPIIPTRIQLKDQEHYLCRPLRPSDARMLREFFYSHTEETIRSRYGFQLKRMSLERALELTAVEQSCDVGLGLFSVHGANQSIEAVGRYFHDEARASAEVAFVTRESRRRVGMARYLLKVLISTARHRELHTLWAQVERGNTPMLRLFQNLGFISRGTEDIQTIKVQLSLEPAESPSTASNSPIIE